MSGNQIEWAHDRVKDAAEQIGHTVTELCIEIIKREYAYMGDGLLIDLSIRRRRAKKAAKRKPRIA